MSMLPASRSSRWGPLSPSQKRWSLWPPLWQLRRWNGEEKSCSLGGMREVRSWTGNQGPGLSTVLQLAALVRHQSAEADIKLLTFPAKAGGRNNQDFLLKLFGGVVLFKGNGFLLEINFQSPFILWISFKLFMLLRKSSQVQKLPSLCNTFQVDPRLCIQVGGWGEALVLRLLSNPTS